MKYTQCEQTPIMKIYLSVRLTHVYFIPWIQCTCTHEKNVHWQPVYVKDEVCLYNLQLQPVPTS